MTPAPRDRTPWLVVIPVLLAAAAYARVLNGEFAFDDRASIAENGLLRSPWTLLSEAGPRWLGGGRPLTDPTFAWNLRLGGLDPFGFHLANVVLHLGVVLLVLVLARKALELAGAARPGQQAVVVAGLFALHPLQSQAVSYVVQRAEVLASGLMLVTLLALFAADRGGRGAAAWCAGAVAALALALGAKPMAVTAPALATLLLLALPPPGERFPAGRARRRLAGLAGLAAVALAHGLLAVRSLEPASRAGFGLDRYDPWTYLLTQLRVVATYLRLLFFPAGQSIDWGVAPSRHLADPGVIPCGLLLAGLGVGAVAACVAGARRPRSTGGRPPEDADLRGGDGAAWRVAGAGVLWYFLALAPTSSVVPLGDPLFEHRTYLANLGIFLAVVALAERGLARLRWRQAGWAATALVGATWLALAVALHARNAVWESELALWTDATRGGRGDWRAWQGLAEAHRRRGDVERALAAYRAMFERSRGRPGLEALALRMAADAHLDAGQAEQAIAALQGAERRMPGQPDTGYGLAYALLQAGRPEEADAWLDRTLAAWPAHGSALQLAGLRRAERGDPDGARQLLERAVRALPRSAPPLANRGAALERLGRRDEACRAWRDALTLSDAPEPQRSMEERRRAAGCPAR